MVAIAMGGFLLFIVPGIIFAIWFILAHFVLVAENQKGMNALLKSREYVKENCGGVFWRLFFMGLISFFVISFFLLGFGIDVIPHGEYVKQLILWLFLVPLTVIYGFLVYSHLKATKGEIVFTPTNGQKAKFIVVGVVGFLLIPALLFSAISANLGPSKDSARDARRVADLAQLKIALELYAN